MVEQATIWRLLEWAYAKAVDGLPGVGSAEELAAEYRKGPGTLHEQADALIRWQNAKCASVGFLSGLGGVLTLPVAVPANLSSVLYMQIRMITAIACLGGHDVRDDKVKTLVFLCLCGSAATELLKELSIKLGQHISRKMLERLSTQLLERTQRKIGAVLLRKFSEKGLAGLGRGVPIVGAIVGGTLDALATYAIGEVAKRAFLGKEIEKY